MTRYTKIEDNSSVTDVLLTIIAGWVKVKYMAEHLKQPQPTVSTKLRFLRSTGIVKKDKWSYEVNWNKVHEVMYDILRKNSYLSRLKKGKTTKNLEEYFPKSRLNSMLLSYAKNFPHKEVSLTEIVNDYIIGLMNSDAKIKDEKLLELKKNVSGKMLKDEIDLFEYTENLN